MNRLISYPRSGNHWVRFIIEFLSNRPTDYLLNEDDGPIHKNTFYFRKLEVPSPIHIKNKDPIFYKQHDIESHPEVKNDEKVILIIRDPKEAVVRHNLNLLFSHNKIKLKSSNGETLDTTRNAFSDIRKKVEFAIKNNIPIINEHRGVFKKEIMHLLSSEDVDDYFRLIQFYDDFNGDKLLIRYENLVNKCEDVAKDIYDFLKIEDEKYLNDFIARKEYLAGISRSAKGRKWLGSVSGNDLSHWSKQAEAQFPSINLDYFDEYMFEKYNFLIEKYNIKI